MAVGPQPPLYFCLPKKKGAKPEPKVEYVDDPEKDRRIAELEEQLRNCIEQLEDEARAHANTRRELATVNRAYKPCPARIAGLEETLGDLKKVHRE